MAAAEAGRLAGILNGCDYSVSLGRRPGWQRLVIAARETLNAWLEKDSDAAVHELAMANLTALPKRRPLHVLTSVGRLVAQKMQLFLQPLADGRTALEHILEGLGRQGIMLLLGSGDKDYEHQLYRIAQTNPKLIFLRGYAEEFGNLMYHGGLHDTVESGVTGFVFAGRTPLDQGTAFVDAVERALDFRHDHPNRWQTMRDKAAAQRFDWVSSAQQYIEQMYEFNRS